MTYQAYYLLDRLGSAEDDVPRQIFLGTLAQAVVVVVASLVGGPALGPDGPPQGRSWWPPRSSTDVALFIVAAATDVDGFLVGMAVSGLGFGLYMAVDLALVADVLPDEDTVGQGPGRAEHRRCPAVRHRSRDRAADPGLAGGSYQVLYGVGRRVRRARRAVAILPVRAGPVSVAT